MADYCTVADVTKILPDNITIGTNKLRDGANITTAEVEYWIDKASETIDSYLSAFYRVPLVTYKIPDFSQNPVTFTEEYPPPIELICARLAAGLIFDDVFMAQQEPNVSEWGKNQRSLAYDDLKLIQAGAIQLKGQEFIGLRFVRQELFDPSRMPSKDSLQLPQRQPGD